MAAICGASWLGYGALARQTLAPLFTARLIAQTFILLLLALLVQIPTMAAYVLATHALAPQTKVDDLLAASTIVMFAASIPISFAGWGVREMSAIAALGAVGVAVNDAFAAAIVIGAGSILAMTFLLAVGGAAQGGKHSDEKALEAAIPTRDYAQALAWCLPIAAAVSVLFQIYVPIGTGLLNVNLADPIALLAGSLFLLQAITTRTLPRWRVGGVNIAAVAATVMLGASLLIGASRFGLTDWALINRFVGWFVLLAFAATGALITTVAGRKGLRVMLLSYVGAALGVAVIEIVLVAISELTNELPQLVEPGNIEAFALNRNFFAFQLLMAACVGIVLIESQRLRIVTLALLMAALWYSGSRSGWLAFLTTMVAAISTRHASIKEIAFGLAGAAACIGAIAAIAALNSSPGAQLGAISGPELLPSSGSTAERLLSMTRGWEMFLDHPIFGAGLGAFRNLNIRTGDSVIPLLIHSTPLWLMAELGLIGLIVFAAPGLTILITQFRLARTEPMAAIAFLCIVSFAVMGGPAEMIYQRTFWLIIGATLAVPALATSES
ncbi:O-antigen ligase family protein [Rhodoplanes sp. Z2-YC6860]|uniref:O-antigen ligase family protein n=1 Tax=Rhodoplanes sp. Z2-YC6860 TaxID=674703 RepID=UPI000829B492|nr:O-antigen ligase family protein [Rhodoplanes sp. Z2-YC6860]